MSSGGQHHALRHESNELLSPRRACALAMIAGPNSWRSEWRRAALVCRFRGLLPVAIARLVVNPISG